MSSEAGNWEGCGRSLRRGNMKIYCMNEVFSSKKKENQINTMEEKFKAHFIDS